MHFHWRFYFDCVFLLMYYRMLHWERTFRFSVEMFKWTWIRQMFCSKNITWCDRFVNLVIFGSILFSFLRSLKSGNWFYTMTFTFIWSKKIKFCKREECTLHILSRSHFCNLVGLFVLKSIRLRGHCMFFVSHYDNFSRIWLEYHECTIATIERSLIKMC